MDSYPNGEFVIACRTTLRLAIHSTVVMIFVFHVMLSISHYYQMVNVDVVDILFLRKEPNNVPVSMDIQLYTTKPVMPIPVFHATSLKELFTLWIHVAVLITLNLV